MSRIYLDYASLSPIDPRIIREMKHFSSISYANPSSIYKEGVLAKKALETGRKMVAEFLGAHSHEIFFTGGGTEANNIAIFGAQKAYELKNKEKGHIIISAIEHSSVMEIVFELEKRGVHVTYLSVGKSGVIDMRELKKSIRADTFLVSIMTVNNEIGTIQPIKEIAKIIRQAKSEIAPNILFHTDASQAALYIDLKVLKNGVDLLTLDSSKIYGPRGIGALFIKRGIVIEPTIFGGGQERGIRSGTENVPAVMGFAKALEIASKEFPKAMKNVSSLKEEFWIGLKSIRSDITRNPMGANESDLAPHILNVNIPGIDNEFFVLKLDAKGISCSTKSSCLRDQDESYVLKAIGADSGTSIRFSFGRWTKRGDIKKTLKILRDILV